MRLRTPTPIKGIPKLAEPWVSCTPHNLIKASSQSKFIKDRIARHQGSSLTLIIAALDCFKGHVWNYVLASPLEVGEPNPLARESDP